MKWQFTIFVNVLIVFVFWLAGFLVLSPAFNHFIQYTETNGTEVLPVFTSFIFSLRFFSLLIPLVWLVVSTVLMNRSRSGTQLDRLELVQLHTSLSVLIGLTLFLVFALAGTLPFLKFSEVL